ncbi:hypothetical protein F4806DRAFT_491468 [Annulohypoxylon nitens]|nr:hypothetical protein F4806DRAFT_491468 [Annulohypoxylon nitens]
MATTMGLCEVFVQVPQRLRHLRARLVIVLVWDSLTLLIIDHVPPKSDNEWRAMWQLILQWTM